MFAVHIWAHARTDRYVCKQCELANKGKSRVHPEWRGQSFNPWDAGVLAKIDDFVAEEFPFIVTMVNAISKTLRAC